jgi:hypothetical protein
MLLQRFQVFLLVLLLVTVLHHIAKDRIMMVQPIRLPRHVRLPNRTDRPIAPLLIESDSTVMYAFHPVRPKIRRAH